MTPAARLAWQRLAPERWPVPPQAFPPGCALVGGAVRDALLNRLGATPDLDLVLPGDAVALCRQLRRQYGGSAVVLDAERSIARLVLQGWTLDLARQEGGSLTADLQRRDYTINAMALPLAEPPRLVDPLGGEGHLASGDLVAVAEANLLDDPLRLLRGVRLASELGFRLEARTQAWIQSHAAALANVAGERVLAELEKLAAAPAGAAGLAAVWQAELLRPWLSQSAGLTGNGPGSDPVQRLEGLGPERAAALGLTQAESAEALPLARLAALLDASALEQLRSSRRLQQRVERLRHWQRQPHPWTLPEAERLHLHRQLEADLPALLLSWPHQDGATATKAARWLQRWRDPHDPLFHPRPAIDGGRLQQELGLTPSRQLGRLLEHLMLERAFGRIHSPEDALLAAHTWLASVEQHAGSDPRRD